MEFTLTYDAETDVAYLTLAPTGAGDVLGPTLLLETDRSLAGVVSADFTVADGRLVGFEFASASLCLPQPLLLGAARIDGGNLARRFEERFARRVRTTAPTRAPRSRAH